MANCKSCGATITWAETATGKAAPFEVDVDGNFAIVGGRARFVGKERAQGELGVSPVTHYTNHFATCKDAAQWRSKR